MVINKIRCFFNSTTSVPVFFGFAIIAAAPTATLAEVEISGGLTMIGQGASGVAQGEADSGFNYSVDLQLQGDVGDGTLFVYFDTAEGTDVFSGANADYEAGAEGDAPDDANNKRGYTSTGIAEAWYQMPVFDSVKVTVGKIDPTGIYDSNAVANDQTSQFLANVFVNNAAIPFPAYTIGFNAGIELGENFSVNIGTFEDGGIVGSMENTMLIGEAAMALELMGGESNVRLTYWQSDASNGFAINADQSIEPVTLFLRYGAASLATISDSASQEEIDAAATDVESAMSLGLAYDLSDDLALGAAYSQETPRDTSRDARTWMEAYVSMVLDEDVSVALDYQAISAPDFTATTDGVNVYGLRLQIGF